MSIQTINNTPVNSGLGDSLYVAFGKVNNNFAELENLIPTKTSNLINDGSDTINQFISTNSSISMSAITGLNTTISGLQTDIDDNTQTINTLQSDIIVLNNTISTLNGIINTQNGQIATMQGDIANIYNIINNL